MPANNTHSNHSSKKESWLLLAAAASILLLLFFKLFTVLQPGLQKANIALREQRAIVLEPGLDATVLKKIITDGNYYADKHDIDLLTDSLAQKLSGTAQPDNLGALNKSAFSITAPLSWNTTMGGADFQGRLNASRQRLGFDSAMYVQELTHPVDYPSTLRNTGNRQISGRVLLNDAPMQGVLVQLRQHIGEAGDSIIVPTGYTRTGPNGEFLFTGLPADSGYSVLPMKPGFEFGNRRGTSRLEKNASYTFAAKPHRIRLLGTIVYGQLKEDNVLLVRTRPPLPPVTSLLRAHCCLLSCLFKYCYH